MADKKYRMTVTLTDGTEVDAGIITAPQGPKGKDGDKGDDGDKGEVALEYKFVFRKNTDPAPVRVDATIPFNRPALLGDMFLAIWENTITKETFIVNYQVKQFESGGVAYCEYNRDPVLITGSKGSDGANGTTFTPSVDASGNLSWTNDGGKENPTTVNIKGANGATGASYLIYTDTFTGESQRLPISKFNRTPTVGEYFLVVMSDGNDVYLATLKVSDIQESTSSVGYDKSDISLVNIKGAKGDPGLTDEQIQMFTYLAQHMTVDKAAGTVTFSLEIVAPSFNAVTE